MSLLKWLGIAEEPDTQVNSLGEIERALTELPPADARYVAAFAYILHRIARADHEISDAESALIEQLVACLLYTSPSPRDGLLSRMPSSA